MSRETTEVQSLSRSISLLKVIAQGPSDGCRLHYLVEHSCLPKPTVHRLLKQMVAGGLLRRGPEQTYQLGQMAFELGIAASNLFPIREIARPVAERLANETGDVVFLGLQSGIDLLCIDQVRGPNAMNLPLVRTGYRQLMGIGSCGFAMLSFLEDEE